MLKKTLLTAMCAVLFLVAPAMASLDVDGTPFDVEWDCSGWSTELIAAGYSTLGSTWNSATFNDNYHLGLGHLDGWLTTNGNGGGTFGINHYYNLVKANGWTVVWTVVTHNYQTMSNVLIISDDTNMLAIDMDVDTITLRDAMAVAGGGGATSSLTVDLTNHAERTFRMVRQPGSATVEVYVDNAPPAASVTPAAAVMPWADEGNLNVMYMCNSLWESSIGFVGAHPGATIPEPVTMLVLALGGLAALLRRKR